MAKREQPTEPDVAIGARVKAKSLRFRAKPQATVRARAEPSGRTASGSERRNLPDEVEPGVTYRDVEVRWVAAARIEDREEPDTG